MNKQKHRLINLAIGLISIVVLCILYRRMPKIGNHVTISVFGILIAGVTGLLIRNTYARLLALTLILIAMIVAYLVF